MNEPTYQPGKCFYGIPVRARDNVQRGTTQPCNIDAREYLVTRYDTSKTDGPDCRMWLCLNHRDVMTQYGFTLTLVS
jgi:hypothetical protein